MTPISFPAESTYLNSSWPPTLSGYSLADTLAYLTRIQHPSSDLTPSLALLDSLLLAHHLSAPYDTSALHVPWSDWTGEDPNKVIEFGKGDGMELFDSNKGAGNFDRIVRVESCP